MIRERERLSRKKYAELQMSYLIAGSAAGALVFVLLATFAGAGFYGNGLIWILGMIACGVIGALIAGGVFDSRFYTRK
jgi:amino acid transporter